MPAEEQLVHERSVEESAAKKPRLDDFVELERDAAKDSRPKLEQQIAFVPAESTLNVVPAAGGRALMALSEGGLQYLVGGARANVGVKAGRYLFEVSMLEFLNPPSGGGGGRGPMPRQLLRVGFSTEDSSLVLGDGDVSAVFFDAEGFFSSADAKRAQVATRAGRDDVLGVLLNLDTGSPNAGTVSLFRNGERASAPQQLPEQLRGKALFPHIAFRNVTVEVNFGPGSITSMPFACNALQDAAAEDVVVRQFQAPESGKYNVLFPVGFPDEGTFAWLDAFLEKNPDYVELSDRKIIEWALKSGFWRNKANSWKSSKDKPDFNFGVPLMDDLSVRRVLNSIASVVPRNYVVMEVKQNLVAADRQENLKKFPKAVFRRTARVAIGNPNDEFKQAARKAQLKEKQAKAEIEWKARKIEKERKKMLEKRKQELARQTQSVEENQENSVKEQKEENKDEEEDSPMPVVTLTEEDETKWFAQPVAGSQDMTQQAIDSSIRAFSIPEKQEGFDEVVFEWVDEKMSKEYLAKKVSEKKRTARIDGFVAGPWFKEQLVEWSQQVKEWQGILAQAKAKKSAAPADGNVSGEHEACDVFAVENVCDVGNGEPLFIKFGSPDWLLLNLRWELFTMVHAFKKDSGDEDSAFVPEAQLGFYYSKYYRKQLIPKVYGKQTISEVVALVKDTVLLDEGNLVALNTPGSLDVFIKHAEERRRERERPAAA
eukprot:TRINITY_DN2830_c0_g1_i1.p1 TRINITY_DN2830_c0_g1~~TRINITY_DN2830_c0_g1_i1.p1  ORF type:complete len:740 (-),score=188.46 TRINITY_DN2830_c0_g1_i1:275-2413(-)